MKNWQFITLLIVNIIGFGIVIFITQATNSFMYNFKIIQNDTTEMKENLNQIKESTEIIQLKVDLL